MLKWNKPYKDPALREKRAVGYRKVGEFLKLFVDQGGKLIASTGAPSGGSPGVSLHNEIRMYREVGLTPMQAISFPPLPTTTKKSADTGKNSTDSTRTS